MSGEPQRLDWVGIQAGLGIAFQRLDLLEEALTHTSYVNEYPDSDEMDSQRLEYLGDAILDFVVGEWLFERYPDAREGELTTLRARIVSTRGLAGFALEIGVGEMLRLGNGEEASGGRQRRANLCAAFEAIVGAIYRDQGIDAARRWVVGFLEHHAAEIDRERESKDPKSQLQEHVQAELRTTPIYRIVAEQGPDHAKVFTAQVLVKREVWGQGTGLTKQEAEQASALAALAACCPQAAPDNALALGDE